MRVERLMIRLADGPPPRGNEADEVAGDRALYARAGVDKADVAAALVGQEHGVAESAGRDSSVRVGGVGVISRADDEDRILGGGVPGSGVAVGAAPTPRGARCPQPPTEHWAAPRLRSIASATERKLPSMPTPARRSGPSPAADVLVDVQVVLTRLVPGIVGVHRVSHERAKLPRLFEPQPQRSAQARLDSAIVGVLKGVSIALFGVAVRVVAVEHGVDHAANGADHRHGPVAQADHRRQSARLEHARHHQEVSARVDEVRELLAVADLQVAVGILIEMVLEMPEVAGDAILVNGIAEQYELGVVCEGIKERMVNEMHALLPVQAAHVRDDRARVFRNQNRSRRLFLFSRLSSMVSLEYWAGITASISGFQTP